MSKNNSVTFSCSALAGVNKVGDLKPDADGYYEMVVGALNVYNSAGQFYVFDEAKELFSASSQLQRRVSRGTLRGEYGHPKMLPGMTQEQFAHRVMSIYEENVCCHHKAITLDFDRVKDSSGKPVIAIISKVYPSGPHGNVLERSLKNKSENVCFSIRSFTDDYNDRGITKRILRTIVTWDMVNEPGLSVAEKFQSPALESSDLILSRGSIERGMRQAAAIGVATESARMNADELYHAMGWEQPAKPGFLNW